MSKYQKSLAVTGAWVDKSTLKNGQRAKIVSETNPMPSNFKNDDGTPQTQDVAKIRFEGSDEAVNTPLNRTTINGLVDAFGEDSKNWQGNVLTCYIEKGRYGGKASHSLYLIPAGFEMQDDENGYAQIVPIGLKSPQGTTKQSQVEPNTPENNLNDLNAELQAEAEKIKNIPF